MSVAVESENQHWHDLFFFVVVVVILVDLFQQQQQQQQPLYCTDYCAQV